MTTNGTGPIDQDWARWDCEVSSSLRPVPARVLAERLGQRDVAALEGWAAALNAVGADLATQGRTTWPHAPGTPTAVMLREIGRLARRHPAVSTLLGEALLVMIDATEREHRRPRHGRT